MAFKPNRSYTESDAREQQSIDFINRLLRGTSALPELKYGEKGPNIDGYIQLLDENKCINGKLTIQVKTVSPSNEGKNEFPCPTSLFAYAERTIDVVFLMAVDHSQQTVLWKYISRPLINENRNKENQLTITLHFDDTEKLTKDNITETITRWNLLFLQQRDLIVGAKEIQDENEKLRHQLVSVEAPKFTIPQSEVVKIQKFSDAYNGLLDREFKYIKTCCYPNSWKQGIAIFNYQDKELLYSLYSINYGENSLLIKQLPKGTIQKTKYNIACHCCIENPIKDNTYALVKERITDDVKKLFSDTKIVPPYENYIIEYIREFVSQNYRTLGVSTKIINDYSALKVVMEQLFASIGRIPATVFFGDCRVNLRKIYDCINYLLNRGYKGDIELYPPKGKYGETGLVSDWFNSETAFKKMEIILRYVHTTYTDFIKKNFPYIHDKLDMYYNADYVLINLSYEDWPILSINHFYCTDYIDCKNDVKVEFCLEKKHELYKQESCADDSYCFFTGQTIQYNGKTYQCLRTSSIDANKYLFNHTCFIDTFYEVFKERLEQYVEDLQVTIH